MKNRYQIDNNRDWSVWTWLIALVIAVGLSGCDDDMPVGITMGEAVSFSVSVPEVMLVETNGNAVACTFSWTTGTNMGTGASISYTLEIDLQGNSFANALIYTMGKGVFTKEMLVSELNDELLNHWGIEPGVSVLLEARVVAEIADPSVESDVSSVVTVAATPYEPVTSVLYMIGSATPNGWDSDQATSLEADAVLPGVFTFTGFLGAGELKFILSPGTFTPSYQKGADETTLIYRSSEDEPDEKFILAEAGNYRLVVNLLALTFSAEKLDVVPFNALWIVGDATPNGWNIDTPNEMIQDPSDSFIFKFNGILNAGDFKIPTATGDWNTAYYMPPVETPDLSDQGVQLVADGSVDYKWTVTVPGAYKIVLNLREMKIFIAPFVPYTQLWMVGDATPTGWNIDNPTAMTADGLDPNVFTYNGPLNVGEFKIPTSTGDWGADFFMPAVNAQPLTETAASFVPGGTPDKKWVIEEAGNYSVTLNQLYETVVIEKLP